MGGGSSTLVVVRSPSSEGTVELAASSLQGWWIDADGLLLEINGSCWIPRGCGGF